MNLINKLNIISPDDAKKLIEISFDTEEHRQRITDIQSEVENISAIKRDIAYKTGWIYRKTDSKDIKQYIDTIVDQLHRIEECLNKIRVSSFKEKVAITGYTHKLYLILNED